MARFAVNLSEKCPTLERSAWTKKVKTLPEKGKRTAFEPFSPINVLTAAFADNVLQIDLGFSDLK